MFQAAQLQIHSPTEAVPTWEELVEFLTAQPLEEMDNSRAVVVPSEVTPVEPLAMVAEEGMDG